MKKLIIVIISLYLGLLVTVKVFDLLSHYSLLYSILAFFLGFLTAGLAYYYLNVLSELKFKKKPKKKPNETSQ